MGINRYAKRTDANQSIIVADLLLAGYSVETDKDDILVGFAGKTFWYEIKTPDCRSKKTGEIKESKKRDSQKELDKTWKGHRKYITSAAEIIADINKHVRHQMTEQEYKELFEVLSKEDLVELAVRLAVGSDWLRQKLDEKNGVIR